MVKVVAILYLSSITSFVGMVVFSWWWAMFNNWETEFFVPARFDAVGEQWIEGVVLHLTLLCTPFAWYWVFKRLNT